MECIWTERPSPKSEGSQINTPSEELAPIIKQVLESRNWAQSVDDLLNPRLDQITDPNQIMGMSEVVERMSRAILDGEQIAVYGDYDIDGMSGLSLLSSFLEACGAKATINHQPQRLSEGYGVHPKALDDLKEQGATVVITVDTGITAFEAATHAQKLGLDLVITDHHQALEEEPQTKWLINPNRKGDESGLGYLSGTGVAFYFCMALRRALRDKGHFEGKTEPDIRYWLDLFALGTVADHVPLVNDNRNLVRVGLELIKRTTRPGLRALISEIFPDPEHKITSRDIGFSIAPKLNAASRLGRADLSTKLLLSKDHVEAEDIVIKLFELNSQRSLIQKKIFEEAQEQADKISEDNIIIVHGAWHEGVLGIVASKLVEKFGKPAIVLGEVEETSTLRGSMRSIPGLSSVRLMEACADNLLKFGGHDMAAGMQIEKDLLESFRKKINSAAQDLNEKEEIKVELSFDGILPSEISVDDLLQLDMLGPWGEGNPEPLFLAPNIPIDGFKHLKDLHLKGKFLEKYDMIGFFKSDEVKKIQNIGVDKIDALVRPEINRFRNSVSVQLRIEHVRPTKT